MKKIIYWLSKLTCVVAMGIKSVTVDGKAVEGNVLPVAENGATVNVEVVMG